MRNERVVRSHREAQNLVLPETVFVLYQTLKTVSSCTSAMRVRANRTSLDKYSKRPIESDRFDCVSLFAPRCGFHIEQPASTPAPLIWTRSTPSAYSKPPSEGPVHADNQRPPVIDHPACNGPGSNSSFSRRVTVLTSPPST